MSTETTPGETQKMIREIAAIFKDFTESGEKATRLRRSARGGYEQLIDDIKKEDE